MPPNAGLTPLSHLPSLAWQERIAGVMAKVRCLADVTHKAAEELDAIMPAILDRAFRGKL